MLGSLRWLWMVSVLAASCTTESDRPRVVAEVAAALRDEGSANVIVNLSDATDPQQIARLQAAVLSNLGPEFQAEHVYQRVPAFTGRLTSSMLERLHTDGDVRLVQLSRSFRGQLLEAVPAVGADRMHTMYGLTGKGVRVAVVDTGIDLTHPDFEGAVVAQHCFTRGACPPWNLNQGTDGTDGHGHGTGTAAIVASRGLFGPPGFAPEAELVVVKVLDDENRGQEGDITAGLDWIRSNQTDLSVDVVLLSIGSDALFEDPAGCERIQPALARAIRNLIDAGLIVVTAAGNQGSKTGLTSPGCLPGVITTGATYDADVGPQPAGGRTFEAQLGADCRDETTNVGQVACYSNMSPRVDVVVPGGPTLTSRIGGGTSTQYGTSRAAAALGGIAALLRQCNPELSQEALRRALVDSGELRKDARSGRSVPFVRAVEAARLACPGAIPEEPPAADGGTDMPEVPPPPGAPSNGGASGAAGSGAIAPTAPGVNERGPGELLGRFTGDARAEPLGEQRPVDPREPAAGKGGRDRADAGSDDASGPERERGERVSSCGVHGGVHTNDASRGWSGWLLALLWIGVASVRRARR